MHDQSLIYVIYLRYTRNLKAVKCDRERILCNGKEVSRDHMRASDDKNMPVKHERILRDRMGHYATAKKG